jgi:acyl carrier protein
VIKNKIAEQKEISVNTIQDDSNLILDLYMDSLDLAEMKTFTASHFENASNPNMSEIKSVSDLYIMAV